MPDSHATSCSVSMTNCPFVPCPTILLPDVLWQQWGDAKSFSVLPIALFHTSFLSFSDGSSERGIFCTSSSCLQTCNVPVCRWHTAGVRRSQGTDLRCPLSSCSTVVSSALQPVALPLFFSSPVTYFLSSSTQEALLQHTCRAMSASVVAMSETMLPFFCKVTKYNRKTTQSEHR